ncbi:MAG: segregation and condensation protein A [Mycoplasmoidaceae bacterium]
MDALNLKLSDFDGPLDLLLTLVRENKMDIENINILTIADQYLKFVYGQKDLEINEASEYLLIASTLVWIKSKTILSFTVKLSEEEQSQIEAERQKLINQIVLYKKYRDLVPKLSNFYDKRGKMYSKKQDDVEKLLNKTFAKEVFVIPNKISFSALQRAMQNAYEKWRLNIFTNKQIIVQEVSAEEVEKEIQEIFEKYPDVTKYALTDFIRLIDEKYLTDQYLVTCFVCLLDLAKNGQIVLKQEGFDDEIYFDVIRG